MEPMGSPAAKASMLKSATGLSTRAHRFASKPDGFSLIELLVVIVILAIIIGMTVLSMGTLRVGDTAEKEARRLTALMELVAEEALIQGRDYGVEFFEDGYRFLSWDPDSGLWSVVSDEAALRRRTLPGDLRVALAVEGREVVVESEDRRRTRREAEIVPQVAVFSSGEFTPFELFIVTDLIADAWVLRGRIQGDLELLEPEGLR
jgi:general secretion pathway protein H